MSTPTQAVYDSIIAGLRTRVAEVTADRDEARAILRELRDFINTADLEPGTCGDIVAWIDAREGR